MVRVSETPYHFELKEIQFKLIFCFISINIGVMCAGQSVTNVCSICTCDQYQTTIDCGSRKLTSVSKAIPATVETLDLSGNKIRNIENEAFKDLINLNTLYLSGNGITNIPEGAFKNHVNLKKLYLSSNGITNITEGAFTNLVNLETLDLSFNGITNILEGVFQNLVNLEKLYLSSNGITNITEGAFTNLVNLETLSLSLNRITNIPEGAFKNLDNLETLYLVGNKIRNIEEHTFKILVNLKTLDLSFNGITNIPEGVFQNLVNLEKLTLWHNGITNIPEGAFTNLINLEELSLSSNGITNIPEGAFTNLVNLEELYLNNNQIKTYEDGTFLFLPNIIKIELRGNDNMTCRCHLPAIEDYMKRTYNKQVTVHGKCRNKQMELIHILEYSECKDYSLFQRKLQCQTCSGITCKDSEVTSCPGAEPVCMNRISMTGVTLKSDKSCSTYRECVAAKKNNTFPCNKLTSGIYCVTCCTGHVCNKNDSIDAGIGEPCIQTIDCKPEFSICVNNTCGCQTNYYGDRFQCKKYKHLGEQCQPEELCFDRKAYCDDKTKRCICYPDSSEINNKCVKNAGIGELCIQTIDCKPEFSICVNNTCGCQTNYYGDRFQCKKYKHLGEQCQPEDLCFDRKSYCDDKTKRCMCYPDSSEINNTCVKMATMKKLTEIEAKLDKHEKLMTHLVEMMESIQSQLNEGDTTHVSHPQPHLRHTHFHGHRMDTVEAHCDITPNTQLKTTPKVKGHIQIVQQTSGVRVYVTLCVFDTDNPKEVFELHIHEFNDTRKSCDSLGGHFNPHSHQHGVAEKPHVSRHAGAWGNVVANNNGIIVSQFGDKDVSLRGPDSIIGRSIVLNARADIKSDSGERLACCVISKV